MWAKNARSIDDRFRITVLTHEVLFGPDCVERDRAADQSRLFFHGASTMSRSPSPARAEETAPEGGHHPDFYFSDGSAIFRVRPRISISDID